MTWRRWDSGSWLLLRFKLQRRHTCKRSFLPVDVGALFAPSGAVHEAPSPQEEAAAGSAGSRVRGGRPQRPTGPQLGDQ